MHPLTLSLVLALVAVWVPGQESLRLNQVQLIGTHNSYHLEPDSPLVRMFSMWRIEWKYSHLPLAQQFAELGVRQIELDVWSDPEGGRFASPVGAGRGVVLEGLGEPGFKVLHVPDVDYRSTVPTLRAALIEVRRWSMAHPRHLPILVLIEVKSRGAPDPLGLGFVQPPPITAADLDALDAEIRDVLPDELLLTPDEVRAGDETLREALAARGWPRLDDVRGRVMCALDNTGREKRLYLKGRPSLQGRAMFADSRPDDAHAGFAKVNDPVANAALIRQLVQAGLLVRTRADVHTREARAGDTARRDAALASGAHFISTDFPAPVPEVVGTDYAVVMPGGRHARCNPVSGPRRHDAVALLDEGLEAGPDHGHSDRELPERR